MPPLDPASWMQQALVPPDRCLLRLELAIIGAAPTFGITSTLYDGVERTLAGMQSRHWDNDERGRADAGVWMILNLDAAQRRTSPF